MCKRSHLAPSCCHLTQCLNWFQRRAVEVHSLGTWLGYCTVVFASCDSVRVDANASTSSFETEDIIQEELFFNLGGGGILTMKIVLEHHQTPHKLVI